jgi:hypothetical protein
MPAGAVAPFPPVAEAADGAVVVPFHGEDGRSRAFRVGQLPLPGWHAPLAAAFAARVGPAGGRRTLASAEGVWHAVAHFIRFLATLPDPPAEPGRLRIHHLRAFHQVKQRAYREEFLAWNHVHQVGRVLRLPPLAHLVPAEVLDYTNRRQPGYVGAGGPPGYSDGELARLLAAVRAETAAVLARLAASEQLIGAWQADPGGLGEAERTRSQQLAAMAETGVVPPLAGLEERLRGRQRGQVAAQLFLTRRDLPPLVALMVALTGCNVETIKELPAEHRILEGRAVELTVLKRRRGAGRWFGTATWEIGPPGRELHHPGGCYLALHRACARSRGFAGSSSRLWAIWRHGVTTGVAGAAEHCDPAEARLAWAIDPAAWSAGRPRPLLADAAGDEEPGVLLLNFQRLRRSIEVRRTKQMGGHLPSAARTNTYPVLFANYLRGDPTAQAWAEEVMAEAVGDAERAAWAAHRQALASAGGTLAVVPGPVTVDALGQAGLAADTAGRLAAGQAETAWAACTDHDHHPATGTRCAASFLDCFHCANCLITTGHLPRLLALLDAIDARRTQMGEADWWATYGGVWVALRRDVLDGGPFTPAQVAQARARLPADTLLDLVENPWERTP